ncbi:ABC transporter ATP-binding protein [Polymorphospora sp. NPDC050346]|uniref:ABC transporter ATP-binding protein n=1 Tax=Polymorphospora sp. NPDC050346 TaxID=3155780 RepID=UPI0033E68A3D
MSGDVLRVENLSVSVDATTPLVQQVDLRVPAGSTVGLVGESGCGKSMTIMSISRLLPATVRVDPASRIRYDGVDLLGLSERQLEDVRGKEIGFVFQDPMTALNPVYRAEAQIAQVLRRHEGMRSGAAKARARELLELVGIPEPGRTGRRFPHELSGGMRQRVVIAMAVAAGPRLLLADEPTTALDVTTQAQIISLLKSLQDQFGMSIVLVSHDLSLIAEASDTVSVMYAGRIVESGPANAVLSAPQHPYTAGLVRSMPTFATPRDRPMPEIPGRLPAPGDRPGGCLFRTRCEHEMPTCATPPPMVQIERQDVRCWLAEPVGARNGSRQLTKEKA